MSGMRTYEQRLCGLRAAMRQQNLDALVCLKPETTFYLSGFNPIIYSHPVVVVLPVEGDPTLLIHALREDHARTSAWLPDIRLYGAWSTKKTMGPDWLAALRAILEEKGVCGGVLGIEEDHLPIKRMKDLQSIAPVARFVDASSIILEARMIKDAAEIASARKAARLADIGIEAAIDVLRVGGTEREVSIAGMRAMNNLWVRDYPDVEVCAFGSLEGGVQNALWCWCLTGDRVLINCDSPSMRRPAPGEIVVIFAWAVADGIYVESERSVAVGQLSNEHRRAFDAILEIRETVRRLIRPGARIADLFGVAKAAYERLGYRAYIPGRIGHGMGLGAHEEPSLEGKSSLVLKPGMMFTLEPNLRIPEWGGIQHSDTILVTEDGHEFLTSTQNGFLSVPA